MLFQGLSASLSDQHINNTYGISNVMQKGEGDEESEERASAHDWYSKSNTQISAGCYSHISLCFILIGSLMFRLWMYYFRVKHSSSCDAVTLENIMGPDEESEEFLSHVIKFLININPTKAPRIAFIIPTVFSHCTVMISCGLPQLGKAKDYRAACQRVFPAKMIEKCCWVEESRSGWRFAP